MLWNWKRTAGSLQGNGGVVAGKVVPLGTVPVQVIAAALGNSTTLKVQLFSALEALLSAQVFFLPHHRQRGDYPVTQMIADNIPAASTGPTVGSEAANVEALHGLDLALLQGRGRGRGGEGKYKGGETLHLEWDGWG